MNALPSTDLAIAMATFAFANVYAGGWLSLKQIKLPSARLLGAIFIAAVFGITTMDPIYALAGGGTFYLWRFFGWGEYFVGSRNGELRQPEVEWIDFILQHVFGPKRSIISDTVGMALRGLHAVPVLVVLYWAEMFLWQTNPTWDILTIWSLLLLQGPCYFIGLITLAKVRFIWPNRDINIDWTGGQWSELLTGILLGSVVFLTTVAAQS